MVALTLAMDGLLARSPGLCDPAVKLVVIHDIDTNVTMWRGAILARFPPKVSVPTDRRWDLALRFLEQRQWDCAFAIDLSDVHVIRVPACNALPPRLYMASDGCSDGIRKWLRRKASKSRLNHTLTDAYHRFLGDKKTIVRNAGVVGGPRASFEPALRSLVGRFRAHWASPNGSWEHNLQDGGDMVLWNQVGLEHKVVGGYPEGPTCYPMYGTFCGMHHSCRHPDGRLCTRPERAARVVRWVNETRGLYWFGHKMRKSWLHHQQLPSCFPALSNFAGTRSPPWRAYIACCSSQAPSARDVCCNRYT